MPTLDWTCETIDGVTLVELTVTAERTARVRIESNLRPVWPPRRQGRPAAGWDGPAFEQRIAEDDRLVVGYASPAEMVEPPAELTTRPPEEREVDPEDVIRALGDGTPPRDAVPTDHAASELATPGDAPTRGVADTARAPNQRSAEANGQSTGGPAMESDPEPVLPPAVEAYFEALDRRITAAEQLADPDSVDGAREAVTTAGGIEAVEGLQRQLRADRTRLERLSSRRRQLASRLDAVEVPVGRLERLT